MITHQDIPKLSQDESQSKEGTLTEQEKDENGPDEYTTVFLNFSGKISGVLLLEQ